MICAISLLNGHACGDLARQQRTPGTTYDIFVGQATWQVDKDPKAERAHIAALVEGGATCGLYTSHWH